MKKLLSLLLIAGLAACSTPTPIIESGVQLTRSRTIIMKGTKGGTLMQRTYPVTCAPGNEGGTPEQRADAMIAAAAKLAGQVDIPIGHNIAAEGDMREINPYSVSQYRCSVGKFSESVITTDQNEILIWALQNNAMQELVDER